MIDDAQYQRRQKSFEYDIIGGRFQMSLTPGLELKNYFGTTSAATEGSFNLSGIKNPVADALIDHVVAAKSRDELNTAARALDRVLRAGHYWVPQWYKAAHSLAYWDKFGWPDKKPPYDRGVYDTWWIDAAKAATLKMN
jgi:microcin C transport system substrate-binding protein